VTLGLPTPVVAGAPPLTGTLRLYLPSNTNRACDAVLVAALLDDPDTLCLLYHHHPPARRLQTAAAGVLLPPRPPTLATVHSDWTTVATERVFFSIIIYKNIYIYKYTLDNYKNIYIYIYIHI
jgi:hypothetical protein